MEVTGNARELKKWSPHQEARGHTSYLATYSTARARVRDYPARPRRLKEAAPDPPPQGRDSAPNLNSAAAPAASNTKALVARIELLQGNDTRDVEPYLVSQSEEDAKAAANKPVVSRRGPGRPPNPNGKTKKGVDDLDANDVVMFVSAPSPVRLKGGGRKKGKRRKNSATTPKLHGRKCETQPPSKT